MFKKYVLSFFSLLLIFTLLGCSAQTGKSDLFQAISTMEQALEQPNLELLKVHVDEIKHMHEKNQWKIHLIGDEGEYERLNESINRLIAAIEAEEIADAKIELATLKTITKDIYSW